MEHKNLYLRQSITQEGAFHRIGINTPDIIPYGNIVLENTEIFIKKYQYNLSKPIVEGDNWIYLRPKNGSIETKRLGRIYLGEMEPNLIPWPDLCKDLKTNKGDKYYELEVKPNEVGVNKNPFKLVSTNTTKGVLVSRISTPEHPTESWIKANTIKDLVDKIQKDPTYTILNRRIDSTSDNHSYTANYSQRDEAGDVMFRIIWYNAPVGWNYELVSDDDMIKVVGEIKDPNSGVAIERNIQAGYESKINFTVNKNGIAPSAGTTIGIYVYLVTREGLIDISLVGGYDIYAQ